MSQFVHSDNIYKKEHPQSAKDKRKYGDDLSKQYLCEIREKYEEWKAANLALIGPGKEVLAGDEEIIRQRVQLFNEYKNFIEQQRYAEHFDSRSNLHSTALEEFMYYLFKDITADYSTSALIGKTVKVKRSCKFEKLQD